jgi:hypothetical protein
VQYDRRRLADWTVAFQSRCSPTGGGNITVALVHGPWWVASCAVSLGGAHSNPSLPFCFSSRIEGNVCPRRHVHVPVCHRPSPNDSLESGDKEKRRQATRKPSHACPDPALHDPVARRSGRCLPVPPRRSGGGRTGCPCGLQPGHPGAVGRKVRRSHPVVHPGHRAEGRLPGSLQLARIRLPCHRTARRSAPGFRPRHPVTPQLRQSL